MEIGHPNSFRIVNKTLDPGRLNHTAYGVCRAAAYFDYQIDDLNKDQLTNYFAQILDRLSWNTLKPDLYGLKFYYAHVLDKPWRGAELTKASKASCLPDIVKVAQRQQISWTRLFKRVFDIEHCPHCGRILRIMAAILGSGAITKIPDHPGLSSRAPPGAPVQIFDPFEST